MKYLILLCTLGLTISLAAQQASTEKQNNIQFSGGYSRHIKHNLDGFSIDITGIKAIGKNWFLQYGGGFQQYWGKDNKYDDFINALDGPIVQLEGLAPLRLQTAGIQIQAGIGRKINRHLTAGVLFLGRYQGTSVPKSYAIVDVSPNTNSGIQIFDPGYRIDNSPEQQLTAGANCYLLYSPWIKQWWLPGIKLIWQADLKKNTLVSTHFNWTINF